MGRSSSRRRSASALGRARGRTVLVGAGQARRERPVTASSEGDVLLPRPLVRLECRGAGHRFQTHVRPGGQLPGILVYCMRNRARVIHLVRTNSLDMVISRELMVARGEAHATSRRGGSRSGHPRPGELPGASVRSSSRRPRFGRLFERFASDISRSRTTRSFRTLGFSKASCSSSIFRPMRCLKSPLVKVNDRRQSELVENYAAVSKSLRGTRYAAFSDRLTAIRRSRQDAVQR